MLQRFNLQCVCEYLCFTVGSEPLNFITMKIPSLYWWFDPILVVLGFISKYVFCTWINLLESNIFRYIISFHGRVERKTPMTRHFYPMWHLTYFKRGCLIQKYVCTKALTSFAYTVFSMLLIKIQLQSVKGIWVWWMTTGSYKFRNTQLTNRRFSAWQICVPISCLGQAQCRSKETRDGSLRRVCWKEQRADTELAARGIRKYQRATLCYSKCYSIGWNKPWKGGLGSLLQGHSGHGKNYEPFLLIYLFFCLWCQLFYVKC